MTHTVVSESEDMELGFSTCLNSEPQTEIHEEAVNFSESHKKWAPKKNVPLVVSSKPRACLDSFGTCLLWVFSWK